MTPREVVDSLRPWRAKAPSRFIAISRGEITLGEFGFDARTFATPEAALEFAQSGASLERSPPPVPRRRGNNACLECGEPCVNKYCSVPCANIGARRPPRVV